MDHLMGMNIVGSTRKRARSSSFSHSPTMNKKQNTSTSSLRIAILVPYRDLHPLQQRKAQLEQFVPYMTKILCKQENIKFFHIYILEQSNDGLKFNRGKLLNAGFDLYQNEYDIFIFHDIDLLPNEELAEYYTQEPSNGPMHLGRVWERYNGNPHYFGGIVAFRKGDFIKVNGYPNTFWGWGGEDDELYCRVRRAQMTIESPVSGDVTDLEGLTLQEKLAMLRNNGWKCYIKRDLLKEHAQTSHVNGLKSLNYKVVSEEDISVDCTKVIVELGKNGHWSDDYRGQLSC